MSDLYSLSRRGFLQTSVIAGAGLTLGFYLPDETFLSSAQGEQSEVFIPNAFLRIASDHTVTVIAKHLEMGQGVYTGLATLVAEELDADWAQVHVIGAPVDVSQYNNLYWGTAQGTGGSNSIANSWEQLRTAGAMARAMLVQAAAQQWEVASDEINVRLGVVSHFRTGKEVGFGDLSAAAARLTPPAQVTLKDPKDFIYIGRVIPRKDTPAKINGSAIYTQDIKLPGLLTAVVAHPPRFGAKVKHFDASATRAMAGIVDVVEIPMGVAVLARDFWTAQQGRAVLKIEWDEVEALQLSSDEIMAQYKAQAQRPGQPTRTQGNVGHALAGAAQVLEAEFEFPYLAHAAMEPLNCVMHWTDAGCEVWNGEQMQTADQYNIATVLGIAPQQVSINMLYAGGSFGRRANPVSDYLVEIAHIVKALDGRAPVKLVWTREDDTRSGFFRPMYFHKLRASLDSTGQLTGWQHHIVGQSILKDTPFEALLIRDGIDGTSIEGAVNLPYAIPNVQVELTTTDIAVPVLWWRSVGSSHNAFSTEIFIDELAAASAQDPVAFRRILLQNHPRHRAALDLAVQNSDWGQEMPEGRGRGVAVHEAFNTVVAQIAEVTVTGRNIHVDRVICAVECGTAVNPDVVKAQMEGGIAYALSAALYGEITLDKGRVKQSNFHDYRPLRINEMPQVEVHIVSSTAAPTGVGEPGVPPLAPAVANAVAAATGQRLRKLPLRLMT